MINCHDNDMNEIGNAIADWREAKGFKTPSGLNEGWQRDLMLGKLMLVVTEVSEMAEAVRNFDLGNFTEALADTMIRLLDIASTQGIDICEAVYQKMLRNEKRPPLHGKTTAL